MIYFQDLYRLDYAETKGISMKWYLTVLAVALLLIAAGCEEDGEPCPTCPDTNYTDVDPPAIDVITLPGILEVGESGSFAATILSDADIVRSEWDLMPESGENASYFYPSELTEGSFTPAGTRPGPFQPEDTLLSSSYSYDYPGKYIAVLEIEDEDGHSDRAGGLLEARWADQDSYDIHILYEAYYDTLFGPDFDLLETEIFSPHIIPVAAWAESYYDFHSFSHTGTDLTGAPSLTYYRQECGKHLGISGSGWLRMTIDVDFDVTGAMHIWGGNPGDYVEYTVYVLTYKVGSTPETHYLYTERLEGGAGEQSYLMNDNHQITTFTDVLGDEEYVLMFGVEVYQYHAAGSTGGSAVCLDGEHGETHLNSITLYMDK